MAFAKKKKKKKNILHNIFLSNVFSVCSDVCVKVDSKHSFPNYENIPYQKKKKSQAYSSVQYFFMTIPCPSHGYFCFSNSNIPLGFGFWCNMECRSKFTVPFFCLQKETRCLHKLHLTIVTMMIIDLLECA